MGLRHPDFPGPNPGARRASATRWVAGIPHRRGEVSMDAAATVTHRTVALVGGSGSGKTTLAEALLLRAGAIPRMGSIEQGSTVCDYEPEEIARGVTLGLSLAHF